MASVAGETTIEIEADLVCVGFDESATEAVKLKVPIVVGEPRTAPLVARLSPAGSVPEVMDQE
jgi:hypothetical protein